MKTMKASIISLIAVFCSCHGIYSQIPEGYLLQYQQNFSAAKSLSDFNVENPDQWGVFKNSNNFFLQCSAPDSVMSLPSNVAILSNRIFGDFIMEADIMPGNDTDAVHEICLFLGMKYPLKYYYVQLSSVSDSLQNGIFLLKNQKLIRLTGDSTNPVTWNKSKWHKIRLERNIVRRTIRVFLEDMTVPLMEVKDYELIMGSVGFGSFSGSARFDNIKIWAPTVLTEEELF